MLDAVPFEFLSPDDPIIIMFGQLGVGAADYPVTVVVDTGATAPYSVIVSDTLAKRLSLPIEEAIENRDSIAFGPNTVELHPTRIASFRLGSVSLANPSAIASPLIDNLSAAIGRQIDAIVGYEFLRDRVFSIDYAARLIDFTASPGSDTEAIDFKLGKKPMMNVTAMVNGHGPFNMQLDTGTTASFATPSLAQRANIEITHGRNAVGAGGQEDVKIGYAAIEFAGRMSARQLIAITDAGSGSSTPTGDPADGLIGAPFFIGTRLTISYPARKLWLEPSQPAAKD